MPAEQEEVEYRYERKFYLAELSRQEVEMIVRLNPARFSKIFYQRWVNNIYLDSWTRESFHDNLVGSSDNRVKMRIRWYGDLFGRVEEPTLELKIKHGLVNRKEAFRLAPFVSNHKLSIRTLHDLFRRANLPKPLEQDLLKLEPALVNRYQRNYFRSADRAFRVTIDSDMECRGVRANGNTFLEKWADSQGIIVELKYAQDADQYANEVTQHFPFRLTRSSKYVAGIEHVLNVN